MAIQFIAASSQRIELPGLPSLAGVSGWTLMGWTRLVASGTTKVLWDISIGTNQNTRTVIQIEGSDNALSVQARASDADSLKTVSTGPNAVNFGELFHFAGTTDYPSALMRIYLNGFPVATGSVVFDASSTSNTPSVMARIGADAGGGATGSNFMNGLIEDARVYNRILGDAEILTIFTQRGQDRILRDMANQYYMNEQAPGVVASGTGTVVDLGSVKFNGTPTNSPVYAPGSLVYRKRPKISVGARP